MSKNFEFDAPQFINFANLNDSGGDSFFDNSLPLEQKTNIILQSLPNEQEIHKIELKNKANLDIENKEPGLVKKVDSLPVQKKNSVLRKVLHEIENHHNSADACIKLEDETSSENRENELLQKLESLHISELKPAKTPKNSYKINEEKIYSSRKSHSMVTRLDVLNNRYKNQTAETNLDINQHKKHIEVGYPLFKTVKRHASPLNCPRKFISLAEQVEHFYKDTPARYRTKPSKNEGPPKSKSASIKPQACIPKTPNLTTKYRQRKINFPDEKQREEMEIEEMKKHQIKAHPLNEKILVGPILNLKMPVIKKPATVPRPFSLTEVKKKEQLQEPVFHFKAHPVPTSILQGPVGVPPKKVFAPTVPMTPQIRIPKRLRVEVKTPEKTLSSDSLTHPRNTKVEPFSFDRRMQDTLQKKQEFINKVIEEEKKTFNSFKAQPMPQFKNKMDSCVRPEKTPHKTVPQPFNLTQPKSEKVLPNSEAINFKVTPFKAKPATVIHQKPFVPNLEKQEVVLPGNFSLKTEKRALERQKFEEKIKQKEEELRLILKSEKEKEEKREKELALEQRKQAEFKAKPMPRYKPFEIHGSDPDKLTLPQSPKFSFKTREPKNC